MCGVVCVHSYAPVHTRTHVRLHARIAMSGYADVAVCVSLGAYAYVCS